ncbi:unnamed protein product [Vitrella brassicaformis CCMP3155]|uniref:Uncharacterized protein n=1 Tax=Vitrella brassicaformis (strain CCMP3155) TaxID=1169540 RepID=A0A0G4ETL1_VITBC|nr:unnamed protein product [Vitrella brassicaformis CCMP3155]|eukprot:CEM01946.1 unnamed protein product [Vitrella brassicaformis CCMP3155]
MTLSVKRLIEKLRAASVATAGRKKGATIKRRRGPFVRKPPPAAAATTAATTARASPCEGELFACIQDKGGRDAICALCEAKEDEAIRASQELRWNFEGRLIHFHDMDEPTIISVPHFTTPANSRPINPPTPPHTNKTSTNSTMSCPTLLQESWTGVVPCLPVSVQLAFVGFGPPTSPLLMAEDVRRTRQDYALFQAEDTQDDLKAVLAHYCAKRHTEIRSYKQGINEIPAPFCLLQPYPSRPQLLGCLDMLIPEMIREAERLRTEWEFDVSLRTKFVHVPSMDEPSISRPRPTPVPNFKACGPAMPAIAPNTNKASTNTTNTIDSSSTNTNTNMLREAWAGMVGVWEGVVRAIRGCSCTSPTHI